MKLVPTNYIPAPKRKKNKLQALIEEFANSSEQTVECCFEEGEYASLAVCHSTLHEAVKRSGRMVQVVRRGNKIYLTK